MSTSDTTVVVASIVDRITDYNGFNAVFCHAARVSCSPVALFLLARPVAPINITPASRFLTVYTLIDARYHTENASTFTVPAPDDSSTVNCHLGQAQWKWKRFLKPIGAAVSKQATAKVSDGCKQWEMLWQAREVQVPRNTRYFMD